MSLSLAQHVSCPPQVLSQILDGEAVILDITAGIYFGLDDVSTAIWALVTRPGGASIAAIRTKMLSEFDVTEEVLDRDLEAFLGTLQKRGLVVVSDGPAQSA
jgi:hypothetical protein